MRMLITLLFCLILCGCKQSDIILENDIPAENQVEKAQTSVYQNITLTCGCTLKVRANFDCCKDKLPDLSEAMKRVYNEATKHKDPNIPINDFEPSGKYQILLIKECKCVLIVYKPNSCPCFSSEYYPELIQALDNVYELANKYKLE